MQVYLTVHFDHGGGNASAHSSRLVTVHFIYLTCIYVKVYPLFLFLY
jgi:hypothetical protein